MMGEPAWQNDASHAGRPFVDGLAFMARIEMILFGVFVETAICHFPNDNILLS
jgi:hypothetical protein